MRYHEILSEMPMPSPAQRGQTFYHGTSTTGAAKAIVKGGLKGVEIQARGKLAPVADRVYVTPHLPYAITYALGGVFAGRSFPPEYAKGERYGYVFVVPGEALGDVQPDEDSVGAFISDNAVLSPDRRSRNFHDRPEDPENNAKKRMWMRIKSLMTDGQFKSSLQGLVAAQAQGGKRALKSLSDAEMHQIMAWGSHVGSKGIVIPSQCWRIDKMKSNKLDEEGANFFQLAKQIK